MNAVDLSVSYSVFLGAASALGALALVYVFFRLFTVAVENETSVMVMRFGSLVRTIREPGLHFIPEHVFPWVRIIHASLQRDFRDYRNIYINDRRGTTLIVDLWIEFRVLDPERSLFQVDNWEKALEGLLTHAATSVLGTHEFAEILRDRNEIGDLLRADVSTEATRWGLEIDQVMIRQVSLLPEVSRRMFEAVSARLKIAKADVEEKGRLRVAMMEAKTSAKVAGLMAEAKGQYSAAIGRAYEQLKTKPAVFAAYKELYRLSLVRAERMVTFDGFSDEDIRAADAMMMNGGTKDQSEQATSV
jgi:regulator of protease activity HflC (stomatin/prohibitin superfamily)